MHRSAIIVSSLFIGGVSASFAGVGHWQCDDGLYSQVECWEDDFPGDLGDVAVIDFENFGIPYTLDMDLNVNVGSVNVESPDARFLIDDNTLNFAVSLNILPSAQVDLRDGDIIGDVGIITNGGEFLVRGESSIAVQAFDNNNVLQLTTNFQDTTLAVDNPIFNAGLVQFGVSPCCIGTTITLDMAEDAVFTNASVVEAVPSPGVRILRGVYDNQGVMTFAPTVRFDGPTTHVTNAGQITAAVGGQVFFQNGATLTTTDGLLEASAPQWIEFNSGSTLHFNGGATAGEIRLQDGSTLILGPDGVGVGVFHLRQTNTLLGDIKAPQVVIAEETAGGGNGTLNLPEDVMNFGELRFDTIGCCAGLNLTLDVAPDATFTNLGLVNVTPTIGGRFINGDFLNMGDMTVAQSVVFDEAGDDLANLGSISLNGPDTDLIVSGPATMTQEAGVVDGDGELVVINGGTLDYLGGDLLAFTRIQNANLDIAPAGAAGGTDTAAFTFRNTSTLTGDLRPNHTLHLAAPAGSTVVASMPFDVTNHGVIRLEGLGCCVATTILDPAPGATLLNLGLIDVTPSFGSKQINGAVRNEGVMTVGQNLALNTPATLTNAALISIADDIRLQNTFGGTLVNEADGRIEGGDLQVNDNLDNFGVIAPGLPIGQMQIFGNFTFDPTGTLEIEIGGPTPVTEHDQVFSFNTLTLGGTLRLKLVDAFAVEIGDQFTIIDAANINGGFDAVESPVGVAVETVGNDVVVTVTSIPPVGDIDGDNDVDAADLAALLAAWGSSGPTGDLDNDGDVDAADLALLLANWTG